MYGIVIVEKSIKKFEEKIVEISEKHDVISTEFNKVKELFIFTAWCNEIHTLQEDSVGGRDEKYRDDVGTYQHYYFIKLIGVAKKTCEAQVFFNS